MSDLNRAIILHCLITPLYLSGSALRAQVKPTGVEVEMVQSDEVKLPAEFQVALYENLVQQLQEKGKFEHVYRDGDRNAAEHPGTVVLHSTVKGFKHGSERERPSYDGCRGNLDTGPLPVQRYGGTHPARTRHKG